jgi:glycosyltransferase involved in cell wall biosynthesis
MIACDTSPIMERCLSSVRDHVDEVIIVDTGSEDDTKAAIKRACPRAQVLDFTHQTHPDSFILDVESSWERKVPGPFTGKQRLCDFAAARQFGWEKASGEYLLWFDTDDTLVGAEKLGEVVEDMSARRVAVGMLNYDYEHDDRGQVIMRLPRERIVRRDINAHWSQPVHEVLMQSSGLGTFYKQLNVVHHRKSDRRPPVWHNRNLKILLRWFEKNKHIALDDVDPRMLFYMGLEARFQWPEYALDMFERYNKRSGWDEERALAHSLAGTVHERAGRWDKAMNEFAMMTVEFSQNPDGFFGLARCAYYRNDWGKVVEWTERGLELNKKAQQRPTMLMEDPTDRLWRPYVYLSRALMEMGQYTRVVEACTEGLKIAPDEPHLLGNLEAAQINLKHMNDPKTSTAGVVGLQFRRSDPVTTPPVDIPHDLLVEMSLQLWKRTLIESPHRAKRFLEGLSFAILGDSKIKEAQRHTESKVSIAPKEETSGMSLLDVVTVEALAETAPIELPKREVVVEAPKVVAAVGRRPLKIVVWTGPAWEPWSPASLKTGIGGSETAAIFMANELARRGHDVTVLAMYDGEENGVKYVHHERALRSPGEYSSDVFICSRQPIVLSDGGFEFKSSFVWVHDTHCGADQRVKEGLLKSDKVLALSRWHKQHLRETYPFLGDGHIIVTRNGIAAGRFAKPPKKEGNRLIFASSPDRGVERLLHLLPRIRATVPDVELHVYYGFETWKKMSEGYGDRESLSRIKHYMDLLTGPMRQPGVHFHGRVGQQELAEAYLASKVWAYPTWFSETSCISAMEAQAGGCVPVTSGIAALNETVRHGFIIPGAENTTEYADEFVRVVVKLLTNEIVREEYAAAGRRWAISSLGWDQLATEWEAMFLQTLESKSAGNKISLPSYEGL